MGKITQRIVVYVLALIMCFSTFGVQAFAETPNADDVEAIGKKNSNRIDSQSNRYEVTIDVPGKDGDTRHDEVIVMVDGSYSMDEEWEDMKKAIVAIGDAVLDGSGYTQLTLMSFGISPNVVLSHVTSVEQLKASLPSKPGGLLYGRSATNCDGAFEGIERYINNHDDSLRDAFVIYLSDGGANLNSEPVDWIAAAGKLSAANALAVQKDEFNNVTLGNAMISDASKTVYGDALDEMLAKWKFVFDQEAVLGDLDAQMQALDPTSEEYATIKAQFDAELAASNAAADFVMNLWKATNENGKTNAQQWVIEVYKDFYEFADLTEGKAYPVYIAEYAYVDYQKATKAWLNHTFYYVLGISGISTDTIGGVKGYYAGQQAAVTAQHGGIETLYIVRYGYDHRSGWMTSVPNTEFVQSEKVSTLCEALQGTLAELSRTTFNDVVVTDYMSKWVNLDASTLKIIDNSNGEIIWTATEGWLINENRPTDQEVPVIVEKVDPSEYEAGGADVVGNTSGDIYKLSWYVKDGAMLRSHNYRLCYEVDVDVDEEGFEYNKDYPANGNTDLWFKDENGEDKSNEISVPDVITEQTLGSIIVIKSTTGAATPATATFQLQKMEGNDWTDVGEAVAYSAFVDNAYTFADLEEGTYRVVESGAEVADFNLTTVYSDDVVLNKTTAENGDTTVDNGSIFVTNTYTEIYLPVHTLGSIVVTKNATGAETPEDTTFQLQKKDGDEWINVGEAVEYAKFVNNAYNFTGLEEGTYRVVESGAAVEGYTLETTYGTDVVLTETSADNGDTSVSSGSYVVTNKYEQIVDEEEDDDLIEIPDEDIPMADVPKTGDMILPFIGMAIASGVAALFAGKSGKKEDEE